MLKRFVKAAMLTALLTIANARQGLAEQLLSTATIDGGQFLIGFDSNEPEFPNYFEEVRGLGVGEKLIAIDQRPATGTLYGVGRGSRGSWLYEIDLPSGRASRVGRRISPALVGSGFGFDFNPTIDRIRLVSSSRQNLVFNPDTGEVTVATPLFYAPGDARGVPRVVHIAYDGNFLGSTETQLRGIDFVKGTLVTVENSFGTVETIGRLGVPVDSIGGYDVSGDTDIGYAVMTPYRNSLQELYEINPNTGRARSTGFPGFFGFVKLEGVTVLSEGGGGNNGGGGVEF